MNPSVTMHDGIFFKDGKSIFFISGDYPYYRDDPTDWDVKLDQIKAMGIDTISCYIPWRHHAIHASNGKIIYDFTGATYPSRNVVNFIERVKAKGMFIIAKPGPFIHAETRYGGLPDFACPKNNPAILPSKNAWGYQNKWFFMFGKPLPSPLEEPYVSMVKEYMDQLGEHVFKQFCYPDGPIIAIQILNEGIYSQGNITLDNFEYSSIGKKLFVDFLKERYKNDVQAFNTHHASKVTRFDDITIPKPQQIKKIKEPRDVKIIVEWGEFASIYYNKVMESCLESIYKGAGGNAESLPVMINANPPSNFKQGSDTFLVRMVPERMNANYGYTNWIGVVPYRDDSWYRYALMIKRYKGINLEENWGFSDYYDPIYKHGHVSYYQTILAIALGTTGFNVYTAAKTRTWLPDLDLHVKPYPESAPITETGQRTEKCRLIEIFTRFLAPPSKLGMELVNAKSPSTIYFGLYLPYATLHSWIGNNKKVWSKLGFSTPPSVAEHGLSGFHLASEMLGHDYTQVNLEDKRTRSTILGPGNVLVVVTSECLSDDVQTFMLAFVRSGGDLVLAGSLPRWDENFLICSPLRDMIRGASILKEETIVDDFNRHFMVHTYPRKGTSGSTVIIEGNPFARIPDVHEQKFQRILRFLKAIIPFNFLKQIPDANAEGELGSKLDWMKGKYTQHVVAFSTPVVKLLATILDIKPNIQYNDNLVEQETSRLQGRDFAGKNMTLLSRKYKVLTRRFSPSNTSTDPTDFVFIFSRCDEMLGVNFSILDHPAKGQDVRVTMSVPPRSAHALVLRGGEVVAFIFNGIVSFNDTASKMQVRVGHTDMATLSPMDVLGKKDELGNFMFLGACKENEPAEIMIDGKTYSVSINHVT
jgi:beta-galactosidase